MNLISGKWKPIILFRLLSGKMRFGELKKGLGNITNKSLTDQLRQLENDGLISRKVYPVVPPKVEYQLTDKGRSMESILQSMSIWGDQY
ncbi:regulatory protein [Enterococcus silesiacus]|uniref:Regulatory protein n=1 Tax=Enterococcus silesiacus TaxID=332949 RepID=A0AA91GJL2_9ENTE|nr:regulatory protein [Enterococcus silesiacus]